MGLNEILARYREDAASTRELGTKFEELIARYLKTNPQYSSILEWVSLWDGFFAKDEFGKQDTGIDLVAKTVDNEYWAIQCKCYAEGHQVTKSDIDTFLSVSGKMFHDASGDTVSFSNRIIFATTNDWSSHALDTQEGQIIPVTFVGLTDLESAQVDWDLLENGSLGDAARLEKHKLRPHQIKAKDAAMEYYKDHSRGMMIMACGTGKTFTSLRIAESLVPGNGCILFLAPSIALVGQTLAEWMSNTERDVKPICVCSDALVSKKKIKDDSEIPENLASPATTDPRKILRYLDRDRLTVIFSTYQSIEAVSEAQKLGFPTFDLIVCDEAHRTTGAAALGEESNFMKVHNDASVHSLRRLYMTATPRIYGDNGKKAAKEACVALSSMDDEAIYGKEFYHISFGQAVEENLLSDYKVMVLTLSESDVPGSVRRFSRDKTELDADLDAQIWGCLNGLAKNVAYDQTLKNTDPGVMRSAVIFNRTIRRSQDVAQRFNEIASIPESPVKLQVQHIDGSMNALERDKRITWLKEDDDNVSHALSNVRCLCEGVDVPALDAVIFMDSKGSLVDVVQSVGRVMRRAPGKKYGYIIIPILIPSDEDPETALDNNDRYKVVWNVLRALRSHDERLDAEINTLQMRENNKNGHVHVGRVPRYGEDPGDSDEDYLPFIKGQYSLDDFTGRLFARLVLKVGDREYIENWARDVAKVMPALMDKLKLICTGETYDDDFCNPDFKEYHEALRFCVNENVSEEDAIKMLAQQIVTKPIFEKLFGNDGFVKDNSVSKTIDRMLDRINADNGLVEIDEQLVDFHKGVERTMSMIDTAEGKQHVITALYEKFFKNAFPKDQAINGVVYTPIEIVNFILRSVADILKQEFGRDINEEGVNILDPFTGTGTFIAQLMESGLITPENLERKYTKEMYANEITLLAYYIAAVNIENTYTRITGMDGYLPFENILLTDTFNIEEICKRYGTGSQMNLDTDGYFSKNRAIIRREGNKPITLIVGNPPYGANQKSANDNAKKRKYREGIDARIEKLYLDDSLFSSKVNLKNSVYDNYVRAFRWATDRLGDNDGIIAFVTPNGWMIGSAFEGFRKVIEREFSKIYVFNLRGDQNSGDWKREGEKIFGEGSKIGIAITLLVKRKGFSGKAEIQYVQTDDYMKRQDKFDMLNKSVSFAQMSSSWKLDGLEPKPNGDWLVERNAIFDTLIPLAGDVNRKFERHCENSFFVGYSNGIKTNRDSWAYNISKVALSLNMSNLIGEYSEQLGDGHIEYNNRIKWDGSLEDRFNKGIRIVFDDSLIVESVYRPFFKPFFYNESKTTNRLYQMPSIYPQGCENLTICVAGVGVKKDFSCLMTDCPTDVQLMANGQCFPLYWYDVKDVSSDSKQSRLMEFEQSAPVRHDGISQFARDEAQKKYGVPISSEDLFFYVYGYLHSPEYRNAFSDDLKLSLPKIGFVDSYEDFKALSEAGRKLSELHTRYEDVEPYAGVRVNGNAAVEDIIGKTDLHHVTKMKLVPEKHQLVYNEYITIDDIPDEAFEYIVNGRSALGWIVDRYQITTDKESGIVNDPNEYAGSTYILKLVLSVINVSVKTMEIVRNLPKLEFKEE